MQHSPITAGYTNIQFQLETAADNIYNRFGMKKNERGMVFMVVMLITVLLFILSLVFIAFALTHLKVLLKVTNETKVQWTANSGVNQMVYDLKSYYYQYNVQEEKKNQGGKQ